MEVRMVEIKQGQGQKGEEQEKEMHRELDEEMEDTEQEGCMDAEDKRQSGQSVERNEVGIAIGKRDGEQNQTLQL